MSGLFGGGKDITNTEQRIGSLPIQQSSQGVPIALLWGRNRVPPNLLWFDDFEAIENRDEQEAGKGGGTTVTNITYTYRASLLMGLCAGACVGVPSVWRNKERLLATTRTLPSDQQSFVGPVPVGKVITVANAERWATTVAVYLRVPDVDGFTLTPTADYTAVDGEYTFGASINVADEVVIEYTLSSVADDLSALQAADFSFFGSGALGQAAWGYLETAHPDQALGYSGITVVAASHFLLGAAAGMPQLGFEVDGPRAVGDGNPDANAADVVTDVLTGAAYGVSFPGAQLDVEGYANWCAAAGLWVSPVWAERKGVFEYIERLAAITHARPLWSVDRFTLVPLATEALTSGTGSFTPKPEHSGPVYAVNDDDLQGPVEELRNAPTDRYNRVSVRYRNREREYADEVVDADDRAAIDAFGLIVQPEVEDITDVARADVASLVAELKLRQLVEEGTQYKFVLPINYDLLEPLDIIQIEDRRVDLPPTAVRILEIDEIGDDGALQMLAEEVRVTGGVIQARQVSGGFAYTNEPPSAVTVRAVMMPTAATGNQQQLWVGVAAGANWGGSTLWASATGTDYARIADINTRARLGTLADGLASAAVELNPSQVLDVSLVGKATLASVSQLDVDALRSLVWVDGELMAYRDATLTGAARYDLAYLRRALYGTASPAHASGDPWMLLDGAVARIPIDPALLGSTLYLKVTSRNALGTYVQGLDEVSAIPLALTGSTSLPGPVAGLVLTSPFVSTYFEVNWAAAERATDYEVQVLDPGLAVLRTVYTSALVFRYLYADALDDGGAERGYTVKVRGRSAAGTGPWATLAVTNPAPAAVTGVGASGSGTSRTISWSASAETDLAGYLARFSTVSGFDPTAGAGTGFHDGTATSATLSGLTVSVTYYVRVAAFDVWDKDIADLNWSAQYSFTA